jgi:hypothetical protein
MIFEVLVCPCGAAPECPFDQSYDSALVVSLDSLLPLLTRQRRSLLCKDCVVVVE